MRGVRQPHAGARRPGCGRAELGDRRRLLPVAAASVGRCPRPAQPGIAGRGVDAAGRAGASSLAPARRRLPAAAGRLGAVRRARRGGHQVYRRRPVHHRRRLAAEPHGQRAQVPGPAHRPGGARIRQQRRTGQRGGPRRTASPLRGRLAGCGRRGPGAGGGIARWRAARRQQRAGSGAPSRGGAGAGGHDGRWRPGAEHAPAYGRHDPPPTGMPGTAAQQAFISMVAPGAIAAQQRYGIPASVTIAQAIDESGWGQSGLAAADHNLFGIKGTGPAGSDMRPTQEYENGIWVTRTAPFRVYHNIAESIADHGRLLATSQAYQHAMANRQVPDAFAAALTGVYATDPNYGSNLITLMRLYNLYRYDSATATASRPRPRSPRWRAGRRWRRCRASQLRGHRLAGLGPGGPRRRDLGRSRGHGRSWWGERSRRGGRSSRRGGEGGAGPGVAAAQGGIVRDAEGTGRGGGGARRGARRRRGSGRRRDSGRGRGSRPGAPG